MAAYELKYTAEEIDGILESVDKKTIYYDATQSAHGLMSAEDKSKLDALPTSQQIDTSLSGKVDKVDGKVLSTNDYDNTAKAKVDAIPADPQYTDTVYDDTALAGRVSTIEGKEDGWDAKQDALVSGTNIKTVNGESLLGSGNIEIQGGGEENVIESISVNGTAQTVTNKNVDIAVPTKTSDLNNDSGFITGFTETDPTVPSWAKQQTKPSYNYSEIGNTPDLSGFITKSVNDLTNYYLKSETYTKAEVAALIGAIQQFHYEIYPTLPASGENNVLYLIGPTGSGTDKYEEYVYSNSAFTKIGDTSIDLSGYVTTSALNTALAAYTTTSDLTTLLSNKADKVSNSTNGNLAGLDSNGNLTDSGISSADVSLKSSTPKIYSYQYIDQLTSAQVDALKVGDIVLADHSNSSFSGVIRAYYVTYKDDTDCNIDTQFNGENYQVGYMVSDDSWIYMNTEVCSLSDLMMKPNNVTGGHLASFTIDGNVTDSGKSVSDFATSTQGALADTAYQKPSTGIPASDLASGVIPDISGKEDSSNKVTSFQLTPDDTHYPSEKLVKDYVDGICGDIQTILTSI